MFEPLEQLRVEAVSAASARELLDVGCGSGGTTLAVARLLRAKGHSVGIDISQPTIAAGGARAQQKDTPAGFICADAQTHAFAPASVDMTS